MRNSLSVIASVVLSVVTASVATPRASQELPAFDGRWVLESPEPPDEGTPRVLVVRQVVARTNVRNEPIAPFLKEVTVTRELLTGASTQTFAIGTIGGSVDGRGQTRAHRRVEWKDSALVFESLTFHAPGQDRGDSTRLREVWKVAPDGRLHVSIVRGSSDGTPTEVALVYRRSPT